MAGKRTGTIFTAKKLYPEDFRLSSVEARRRGVRFKQLSAPGFLVKIGKILQALGKPFYWAIFLILFLITQFINCGLSAGRQGLRIANYLLQLKFPKIRLPKFKLPLKKIFLGLIIIFFLFSICYLLFIIFYGLPNPNQLITRNQIVTTKIYDRHGTLLYKIYRNQNRTLVELKDIPLALIQATVAIEDAEFYYHRGLSLKGILRAAIRNLKGDKLYGGSTITQQLVKNALLTPERTWSRKIKEIILAVLVEAKFPKDQILQIYLNEVGYGGAAYGVEEAAQMYFGKPVTKLSLAESAILAGLPASPTRFSPFGAHPEKAKERQLLVLRRMRQEGFITEEEEKKATEEELYFAPQRTDIKAPHFVMYVKDLLVQKYGERVVEEDGLEVKTSLDLEVQEYAQRIVSEEIKKLQSLRISNGAVLVTSPKTGEILAMVGSENYFDSKNDGNVNVTLRPRQPGSAIKPVMYSVALENGFTVATIIPDTPITYRIPGQPPYSPRNYDGQFHGNIPLRIALGSSYNVPAVKVLGALGVEEMIKRGKDLGITTWDEPGRFGLSLTLGGGEVKMVDLAVAYGTLANLGTRVDLNPILEVKNYKSEVLESNSQLAIRNSLIVKPEIAYILTDILSDNSARTPAFGSRSWLNVPNHPHVAVKTGTTQNLRDNWTIGYSPDFLVAVWVGNNDNRPMSYVASGVTGASPIWNKIISFLLKDTPDKEFPKPEELIEVKICAPTGTLPCEGCPQIRTELFLPGTEPKKPCLFVPTPTPPW